MPTYVQQSLEITSFVTVTEKSTVEGSAACEGSTTTQCVTEERILTTNEGTAGEESNMITDSEASTEPTDKTLATISTVTDTDEPLNKPDNFSVRYMQLRLIGVGECKTWIASVSH